MRFQSIDMEAQGRFTLSAAGPILIADGSSTKLNPELTDSCFLSGAEADGKTAYVIPGSSIKGVIRHYLYDYISDEQIDCIFGCVNTGNKIFLKSKVSFSDAYADMRTVETVLRTNTKIGFVSQGANQGLNDALAVRRGDFHCSFRMCNCTAKEMEWLLRALNGFNTGEVCIGGRVSRGFGRARISSFHMTLAKGFTTELKPDVIGTYDTLESALSEISSGSIQKIKRGGVVHAGSQL